MLLRRITEHVKAQNWTAVALDFVIVVVGVFIGIQVSNWNAQRADARLESEILANIVADLKSDETELSDGIRMAQINVEAGNYALAAAGLEPVSSIRLPSRTSSIPESLSAGELQEPGPALEPDWLWRNIVVRYHPTQAAAAFDTLVATGRLGLISDRSLVRQLQSYQRSWDDIEISQNETFRPFRDQAIFVGQSSGLSPFTRIPEKEFVSLLQQDPELRGALRTLVEYSFLHRGQLVRTRALTRALLERLEQEFDR